MKIKQNKEHSHWAYGPEGNCFLGEIRRTLEESANFPDGWRVIATKPLGTYLPHEIVLYEGDVVFRGRPFKVLYLENWFYQSGAYIHGQNVYKVERLHFEMDEIPEERDYSIDGIVARLNYGCDRTEAELLKCKVWLLEYQAANEMTAKDLDDFCFYSRGWIFEQIFGKEA